ncbi:hypothetical protein IKG73_03190 [Candidatus Saccharibacteria bacterium]|nr:hypothetical protein [Candidatus Saccharibacteria bacterium]
MNERSRGNQKIAEAAEAFHFDFRGKTVLDIGSSTGGFTEYALDSGASLVVAVEKGTGQMKAPLRFDHKVQLHEKTDIFKVVSEVHKGDGRTHARDGSYRGEVVVPTPDVILADVSFISLREVLEYAALWIADASTEFLVMLKPQFEAEPSQLVNGVVKNERMRRKIIRDFEDWLKKRGFVIMQKRDNSVSGKHGNIERFYLLSMV